MELNWQQNKTQYIKNSVKCVIYRTLDDDVESFIVRDFEGLTNKDMSDIAIFITSSIDIVMLENLFKNLERIALRINATSNKLSDNILTPKQNDRFINNSDCLLQE